MRALRILAMGAKRRALRKIETRGIWCHNRLSPLDKLNQLKELNCPFPERKYEVFRLAALCKARVGPKEEIYNYAKLLQQKGRLTAKDAIHLSCAHFSNAKFFLTCDDKLAEQAKQVSLEMEIMNPVDYIRV